MAADIIQSYLFTSHHSYLRQYRLSPYLFALI